MPLHLGCFVDDNTRTPFQGGTFHGRFSNVAECAAGAAASGRTVFGVEAGGECRSAVSLDQARTLGPAFSPSECNQKDPKGVPAGGALRFNLFQMDETTRLAYVQGTALQTQWGTVFYHGCFGLPGKAESKLAAVPDGNWDVERRLWWAAQRGFEVVGLNDDDVHGGHMDKMLKDLLVNPELRADCHRTDKTKGWAMGKDGMSVYYLPGDTFAAMRTMPTTTQALGDGNTVSVTAIPFFAHTAQ